MQPQQQPTKKFFQDINAAAAEILQSQDIQLPLTNIKKQDASAFTARHWYKDGNISSYHQWQQEIPNQGNTLEEMWHAKSDQQYSFERAEKMLREATDRLGRRYFYHARTAIIYANLLERIPVQSEHLAITEMIDAKRKCYKSEVLRFVHQHELYRAILHWGTSADGHRYLSSVTHFTQRGVALPPIQIPFEIFKAHRKINREFNKQKFIEKNSKPLPK